MFVAQDVLLDVTFGVARARLISLVSDRAFADASRAAYQEGLDRLGPAGSDGPRRAGRLERVRLLPPAERAGTITVGLRWEASGISDGLFPVLDADIALAPASEQTSTLTLSGVYRPPPGHPDTARPDAPLPGPAHADPARLAARVPEPARDQPAWCPCPGAGPPGPAPSVMADVAVRALLRYAAGYLTRSGG